MKSLIVMLFFNALVLTANAQRPNPDELITDKGLLIIQPILHASLVISWDNKTVYIDPYGGSKAFEGIKSPDLVLITDIHGDHMNIETLQAIQTAKATLLVPQAVADQLPESFKNRLVILGNGQSSRQLDMTITAIPMYNLPESADSPHTKGRGNGYVLDIGGKRVYIAGDTEDIKEMRALKNIDVAFVCMNLPYTMDINQAASAVLEFRPKIVYPYHYRGQDGLNDIEGFKKLVDAGKKDVEVRLRNWYPEY
jgi:L-ascorbate metabolism protein UlaG (beta-lactamase superfamily)